MKKLLNALKWGITLGPGSQNFLGAKWIQTVLERTRNEKKRLRALQILSLSPHYFFCRDQPGFAEMPFEEYLDTAFEANRYSRKRFVDEVLQDHLTPNDVVLDYGCGPGFLAKALIPNVKNVYAYDISPGTLACARVLNPANSLEYVGTEDLDLRIPDNHLDVIVSLAVVQHLPDSVYVSVLQNCWRKLRSGGRLVLHIQLLGDGWRTEQEWRDDRSIRGRLKLRFGLNCFARSPERHIEIVSKCGFTDAKIESIADLVADSFDDVCQQHLLSAKKPS